MLLHICLEHEAKTEFTAHFSADINVVVSDYIDLDERKLKSALTVQFDSKSGLKMHINSSHPSADLFKQIKANSYSLSYFIHKLDLVEKMHANFPPLLLPQEANLSTSLRKSFAQQGKFMMNAKPFSSSLAVASISHKKMPRSSFKFFKTTATTSNPIVCNDDDNMASNNAETRCLLK